MKIYEASELLRKKKISPEELKNCIAKNDKVNAFITRCDIVPKESDSPLWGIPVAVKDNICTKGVLTTAASKMLSDFIPPYDATAVERLKQQGAVIIGKTNMDEFGMGSEGKMSYFGPTSNPLNFDFVPGGSSSGSAAAVKAGEALGALGSDTGGSIRQPASFCGLYGLKPTYSLVSRYGLIAFASSLDAIGPICLSAKDCAIMLECIAGYDPKDATSAKHEKENYYEKITSDIKGLKIGVLREFWEDCSEDVKSVIENAANNFKTMDAIVEECSMQSIKYAASSYYIISSAEASSNLARYDGVRFGKRCEDFETLEEMYVKTRSENLGEEVKRRILLGTYVLSENYYDLYYGKANKARHLIRQDFEKLFDKYDIIMTPVCPVGVWKKGEKHKIKDVYSLDKYTSAVSLAGLPAISVPCGKDKNNMPVGMQLVGSKFSEQMLLNAAWAYEEGGFADEI